MAEHTKRCRHCRRTFTATRADEWYCGDGCRWAGNRRNIRLSADRKRGRTGPLDLLVGYVPTDDDTRYQDDYFEALVADPCAYCGQPSGTFDHITHDRAENTWANLTAACKSCNSSKQRTPLLHWLLAGALTAELQPHLEQIERLTGANLRNPRMAPDAPRQGTRLRRRMPRGRAA